MPNRIPFNSSDRYTTCSIHAWFLVFLIAAQFLGNSFTYGVESISVLWPPSGILGATLALLHRRHWISIIALASIVDFASGMLTHSFTSDPDFRFYLFTGLMTNPITAIVFATTFRIFVPSGRPVSDPKVFGLYVLIPIILNTAVVSFLSMSLLGVFIPGFPIIAGWQQWWYSDITGLLVFATPVLMIASSRNEINDNADRVFEAAALLVVFTAVTLFLFTSYIEIESIRYYKIVLMLPVYAWVVSRFGAVVMSLTTVVLTIVVLAAMIDHSTPFEVPGRSPQENVLAVQGFLVPATLTVMFIAAILEHRKRQFEQILGNEQRMRALSRIESLGTMAAGVAHDFGNLAIAVRAYHAVLRSQISEPNDAARQAIKGLEEAADAAQSLTKSLMVFARDEQADLAGEDAMIDLCESVKNTVDALLPLLSDDYVFDIKVPPEQIHVPLRSTDLRRILSNLIFNARDASTPGQRIKIAVRQQAGEAMLLVTDEGEGIPPEILDRIFDPFFTTKPRGRGTGLGLAVVSGIIRDAGGSIHAASTLGIGTKMVITIPIVNPSKNPLEQRR